MKCFTYSFEFYVSKEPSPKISLLSYHCMKLTFLSVVSMNYQSRIHHYYKSIVSKETVNLINILSIN